MSLRTWRVLRLSLRAALARSMQIACHFAPATGKGSDREDGSYAIDRSKHRRRIRHGSLKTHCQESAQTSLRAYAARSRLALESLSANRQPLQHGSARGKARLCQAHFGEAVRPARVLDVGANPGVYSRIAAEAGAEVGLLWDTDVQAADLNWKNGARRRHGDPSRRGGFRASDSGGWLEQRRVRRSPLSAREKFDCVLMLGILHHLLIVDQIPLPAVVGQLADITKRWAILEGIPQTDAQFISLCRGREALYRTLQESYFVRILSTRFVVRMREELSNGRTLWFLEKATT